MLIGLLLIRASPWLVQRSHDFMVGAWVLAAVTPTGGGQRQASQHVPHRHWADVFGPRTVETGFLAESNVARPDGHDLGRVETVHGVVEDDPAQVEDEVGFQPLPAGSIVPPWDDIILDLT